MKLNWRGGKIIRILPEKTLDNLAYIEYPRKGGSLHIYFETMDCKYYMQDKEGGAVKLPKNIAKDFAKILNNKYKHLVPKIPKIKIPINKGQITYAPPYG